jgi:hypothetical protein
MGRSLCFGRERRGKTWMEAAAEPASPLPSLLSGSRRDGCSRRHFRVHRRWQEGNTQRRSARREARRCDRQYSALLCVSAPPRETFGTKARSRKEAQGVLLKALRPLVKTLCAFAPLRFLSICRCRRDQGRESSPFHPGIDFRRLGRSHGLITATTTTAQRSRGKRLSG